MSLPTRYTIYIYPGDDYTVLVEWLTNDVPVDTDGMVFEWDFGGESVFTVDDYLTVEDNAILLLIPGAVTEALQDGEHHLRVTSPFLKTLVTGGLVVSG